MEIGHRNTFIMNQYAARYKTHPGEGRQGAGFDSVLGTVGEDAAQKKAAEETQAASEQDIDYRKFLQEKMDQMRVNIRKGTIQPKFKIGGEAYTQEEWQELLDKIDAAEEVLREQMEEKIAAAKEAAKEEDEDSDIRIITRADGTRIMMITTSFGEMSVELSKPDDSAAYSSMVSENNTDGSCYADINNM